MNRDYETPTANTGKKSGLRFTVILALLAFVGGVLATGWAAIEFDLFGPDASPAAIAPLAVKQPGEAKLPAVAAIVPADSLAAKVAELEDSISRITSQAEAASGNAARAEGMLIAFAARRALDTGSSLGYIEGQLQLRFGKAQPNAVATIINASRRPVTIDQLRSGLDELAPKLVSGAGDEGMWTSIRREMGALFVLRSKEAPSTAPEQRLERAQVYLESNRVAAALAEVKLLPTRARAKDWIALATNYITARQALDLIETAAILEPKDFQGDEAASELTLNR